MKLRILKHNMHRGGAMVRRHRPHFPSALQDMSHCGLGRLSGASFHEERANPVAVNADILVAALGNYDFIAGIEHQPNAKRIFTKAPPETLVGDIDKRNDAPLLHYLDNFAPLILTKIRARRVVATAVKESDVTGLGAAQRLDHIFKPNDPLS